MARVTINLGESGIPPRPPPPPSPPPTFPVTSELDEIRTAWRKMKWAEYEIQRLGEYVTKSKSMKDDLERHHKNYREANAKLNKLLND